MADAKITSLTADAAPTSDDLVVTVNDPGGTPANKKVTLANLALGIGAAWTGYTPTYTNLTVGNGTHNSAYYQVGKLVVVRISFTFGSTSSMGTGPTFSLPVTSISPATNSNFGMGYIEDSGVQGYYGVLTHASTTTASFNVIKADATYLTSAQPTSTVPFSWGTNDYFRFQFFYEAA